ncbi:MAG: phage tail length tape measure family protein, partial [Burkholderiaceae bacterium]|nr:phage tail length tape measure family protein [Burkholderiaceae bacterium]
MSSSNSTEELGIRLSALGVPETTSGINLAGKAVEDFGKKADGANVPVANMGATAKQTAQAFRLLPAQITDVVTSLASGSPAWLVAIQQGGQIKDSFGGIGPMFGQIAKAIGPMGLAVGGATAVVGGLVAVHVAGQREAQGYAMALIMSGNAAGTNAAQMADMARSVSQTVGTQGKAAEAMTAIAATGEVARVNLQHLTEQAVRMERDLGQSIDDTAKKFELLGRSPLEASLQLNRGLNYLTASTYDHIRALQAEGRVSEAGEVAQKAYADAMRSRADQVKENLGAIETVALAVGRAGKWMWDQLIDVGRPDTLEKKLAKAKADIDRFRALPNQGGGGLLGM